MKQHWFWVRWAIGIALLSILTCLAFFAFIFWQTQTVATHVSDTDATKFIQWETLEVLPTEQQIQTLQSWELFKKDLIKTQEANVALTRTPIPTFTQLIVATATAIPTNETNQQNLSIYLINQSKISHLQFIESQKILNEISAIDLSQHFANVNVNSEHQTEAIDGLIANGFQGVYPSPDNLYWILLKPAGFFSAPIVFDTQTGNTWYLYQEYDGITSDGPTGHFLGWHPDSKRVLFAPDGGSITLMDVVNGENVLLSPANTVTAWTTGFVFPSGQNVLYSVQSNLQVVSTLGGQSQSLPLIGDILSNQTNRQGYFLFRSSKIDDKNPRYQFIQLDSYQSVPFEIDQDIWWAELNPNSERYILEVQNREKQAEHPCSLEKDKTGAILTESQLAEKQALHCSYVGREIWIGETLGQPAQILAEGINPKLSNTGQYLAYCTIDNQNIVLKILDINSKSEVVFPIVSDEECKFSWGE
jgi:hypothetical protein